MENAGGGQQLYLSLKMENYKLKDNLIPHVYGSVPLVGSWDPSKAVITPLHHLNFEFSFFVSVYDVG